MSRSLVRGGGGATCTAGICLRLADFGVSDLEVLGLGWWLWLGLVLVFELALLKLGLEALGLE